MKRVVHPVEKTFAEQARELAEAYPPASEALLVAADLYEKTSKDFMQAMCFDSTPNDVIVGMVDVFMQCRKLYSESLLAQSYERPTSWA